MTISIVIPAYNEEKRLPPFLSTVLDYAANEQRISEILVVDDGSTDATPSYVRGQMESHANLRLVSLSPNKGKGAAICEGVMAANADYIVFIDADGATKIDQLSKMISAFEEGADVAVGNRWLKGADVHRSTVFRHVSGWLNKTYMSFFGLGDIDTMCGFKGYKREVARDLFSNLLENRWLFDTEIAYKAVKKHYSIKNFPVTWESIDGSKLDTKTLIASGLSILPLILKINRQLDK